MISNLTERFQSALVMFTGTLRSRTHDLWVGLKPSRAGLLTIVILVALLFEPWSQQGRDVLLEYGLADPADDPWPHIWFYAATFCFAVLVWTTCRISSLFRFEKEEETLDQYRRLFPRPPFESGSEEAITDADKRVANIYCVREWAPRLLGLLVPLIVAAGFVVFAGKDGIDNALICLAIALTIALMFIPFLPSVQKIIANAVQWASERNLWPLAQTGGAIHHMARKLDKRTGNVRNPATNWSDLTERFGRFVLFALRVLGAIVVASVIIAAVWPLRFGGFFGPFPVAMLALTVMLIIGTGIVMLNRVSNFPWFLILVSVALALSFLDAHYMRFLKDTEKAVDARATPSDLLDKFMASDEGGKSLQPVVFVATAGGASRAAYWTASVLGELNATIPDFDKQLFLISGVSGGSVGALFYRAALTAAPDDKESIKEIAKSAASGDFLSPTLASMFIRDLIPGLPLSDRAEALERAWSKSFEQACNRVLPKEDSGDAKPCPVSLENGFLELWQDRPGWPALILNGTIVESGSRAVASSLRLDCRNPRHCHIADIADILKSEKRDLVASSAANVSARFPLVGPSGRAKIDEHGTVRSVVDGGYFDNFGAITLTQILSELEQAFKKNNLVPIVIQITSDPEFSRPQDDWREQPYIGTSTPGGHQMFKPMVTMLNLRGALGRQAFLNLAAQAERMGGAYFHFGQCEVPAGSAPLGWVLSKTSRHVLDGYADGQCGNADQIERIKACLESPKPGCGLPEDRPG